MALEKNEIIEAHVECACVPLHISLSHGAQNNEKLLWRESFNTATSVLTAFSFQKNVHRCWKACLLSKPSTYSSGWHCPVSGSSGLCVVWDTHSVVCRSVPLYFNLFARHPYAAYCVRLYFGGLIIESSQSKLYVAHAEDTCYCPTQPKTILSSGFQGQSHLTNTRCTPSLTAAIF